MALSDKALQLRNDILDAYQLSAPELEVLDKGLEALDTADKAQEVVESEGVVMDNRFGETVRHPAVSIAKECRAQFLAAMKQLGLADPYGGESGKGRGARKAKR